MLRRFFKRLLALNEFRARGNGTPASKGTILLVSALSSECNTVRVFSLVTRWRLLIAPNVTAAVGLRGTQNVTILLYDGDVPGISWQEGVRALLDAKRPAFLILFSSAIHEGCRTELIALGGYDIAQKPVSPDTLARLVNGCWRLMNDIDNAAPDGSKNRGATLVG